jgi:plastocyanin
VKGRTRARGLASVLGACLLLAAACSSDGGAARGPAPAGDVVLVAHNTAWDKDRIDVPVGRDVVVVIDNEDKGIAHNIHFTSLPRRVATKLENGLNYQSLTVRFDSPGTYPYICDLHPTMKGTAVAG